MGAWSSRCTPEIDIIGEERRPLPEEECVECDKFDILDVNAPCPRRQYEQVYHKITLLPCLKDEAETQVASGLHTSADLTIREPEKAWQELTRNGKDEVEIRKVLDFGVAKSPRKVKKCRKLLPNTNPTNTLEARHDS